MSQKRHKQKMYGFWGYDQFPGISGGMIHSPCEDGEYPGLGYWSLGCSGYFIKPALVVPLKSGLKIQAMIDKLKDEWWEEERKLKNRMLAKFRDALPQFPWMEDK